MYKSPIEIIYGKTQQQMENNIFRAVQSYAINVDKAELIRALQYDRGQYEKGYADGKAAAMADLVRCKDCKHCKKYRNRLDPMLNRQLCVRLDTYGWGVDEDDFCSYGERSAEDGKNKQ